MHAISNDVSIPFGTRELNGVWTVPKNARGTVVFAHGSGSSRFSPRNQFVANALREAGFATLLLDLLDENEEADRANVFDIDLLAERLAGAIDWAATQKKTRDLPIGLF